MTLWPTAENLSRTLSSRYLPAMNAAAELRGVRQSWKLLIMARNLEPDPVSAARLLIRNPYWTEAVYQDGLVGLARQGALVPSSRRSFRLTQMGQALVQELFLTAYGVLDGLTSLPPDRLERQAWLLWQVVIACMKARVPARKWSLEHNRRDDPGMRRGIPSRTAPPRQSTAGAMVRIDQYLSDLSAFRDDCHLYLWRSHGISGPAWEAFSTLWRGQAATLEELNAVLARRRAPAGTYEEALRELLHKGWVQPEDERFQLTEAGAALRQQAEDETGQLFEGPWGSLSEEETRELGALLEETSAALAEEGTLLKRG